MKNRPFVLISFLLYLNGLLYSATLRDAEERLEAIEGLKAAILSNKSEKVFSDEEMEAVELLYQVLEGEEYTASSLEGQLSFSVSEYDLKNTCWHSVTVASLFADRFFFEREIDILYSDAMEKKYVPEESMTEYQRRDYEYYVNEYEGQLQAGETLFYAELTFKLTHWRGASEYRFEPVSFKIFKNARTPRAIISSDEKNKKELFAAADTQENRSAAQIQTNEQRIQAIEKSEKQTAAQEAKAKRRKALEIDEQKGRRTVYLSADTESEDLSFQTVTLNNVWANLTVGLGKFFFAGVALGIDLESIDDAVVYSFGGLVGANVNFVNIVRPYFVSGVAARTDDRVVIKLGTGVDLMVRRFFFNTEWSYNWSNTLDTTADVNTRYHSITAGFGVTW